MIPLQATPGLHGDTIFNSNSFQDSRDILRQPIILARFSPKKWKKLDPEGYIVNINLYFFK